jgi:AAA15 family ATPase/GTPase
MNMFLQFATENHLSIRDRVELSLVAAKLQDFDGGLLQDSSFPGMQMVPGALIYGPNASGKSNILLALNAMRNMVMFSQIGSRPDADLSFVPFALDSSSADKPTTFEIDFITNDIRYNYGFCFTADAITKEWLIAYPNVRPQVLFRRAGQEFVFGRNLKGRNQVIADLTRKNSLFLSAAAQSDHQELGVIYRYFSAIEINQSISVPDSMASSRLEQGNIDDRVISFLSGIGTGVVGFRRTEKEIPDAQRELHQSLMTLLKKHIGPEIPPEAAFSDKLVAIELAHRSVDGSDVYFNLDRESAGTRRLLIMLSTVFEILDTGGLIIIDEIDASLHTHACELLFSLFSNSEFNPKGAQIIATAHDTNLLRSERIRRDQIWLCEKAVDGSSRIFPLTDIHLRHSDNFERGYLQGRFGALPFEGSVDDRLQSLRAAAR